MAIIATLVDSFESLNDDRSLALKPNAASREREAVVDVTFGTGDNYVTDGVTVDFSVIRKFTQVYAVEILHTTLGLLCSFVPASNDKSAIGKIKMFGYDGDTTGAIVALSELPNASTECNSLVLRCRIRGI